MDNQQQANEELEAKTINALVECFARGVEAEDMRVLCYHCGLPFDEMLQAYVDRRYDGGPWRYSQENINA